MPAVRTLMVVGSLLAGVAPAWGQSYCAGIADRSARLDCYDRAARAPQTAFTSPAPSRAARSESCTRSSPCVGPRGGVYYYTASGNKQYLPRR